MDISFAINVLDIVKGIWYIIKKKKEKEEESSSRFNESMPTEEEIQRAQRKGLEEQIMLLSDTNKFLHYLAIREMERMAENPDMNQKLKQYICDILCQYLSNHPDSRPAFDALFKRGGIFVSMKKKIRNAKFVKHKLSSSHTIENVDFINCNFYDCHFHKIHFRNCNIHGGTIHECYFKDKIKFDNCFFNDVHIDNSHFRHVFFTGLDVRGGKLSSSVFLRSELHGVSFTNVEMGEMAFQLCKFQMEDFSQCKMNKVYFEFKRSEKKELEMMQEYLSHMGYHPCADRSCMTLITG